MSKTDCLFITSSRARALQFSIYPYLGVGYLTSALKNEGLTAILFDVDTNRGDLKKLFTLIDETKPLVVGYSIMSISLDLFYKISIE